MQRVSCATGAASGRDVRVMANSDGAYGRRTSGMKYETQEWNVLIWTSDLDPTARAHLAHVDKTGVTLALGRAPRAQWMRARFSEN